MSRKVYNSFTKKSAGTLALQAVTMGFLFVQLLMIAGISAYMYIIDIFPVSYIAIGGGSLFFVWLLQFLFLYRCSFLVTAKRLFCIIISLAFITAIFAAFWYFYMFANTLSNISNSGKGITMEETNTYTVRVLNHSSMQNINDLKGKQLGVCALYDEEDLDLCKNNIKTALKSGLNTKSYEDVDSLTNGLASKKSDAILFDEALASMVEEHNPGFLDTTRVIYEIKAPVKNVSHSREQTINTKTETFNVLITGIDTRSKTITPRGNSDVNIIATINPEKKKILLTSTPRDYFVPLEGDEDKMDKLTHAGGYGPKCSMKTLSVLYDTPIDLYVKTNFVSVERIIDAFGGVTVESETSFSGTKRNGKKVQFKKGTNHLDGASALAYARERKALGEGDMARGRHQQQIVTALIKKATSSSMLSNYNEVLDIIQNNTVTNLSTQEMTDLIKMQLSSPGDWEIESIDVDGVGQRRRTYSYGSSAVYVMIPDKDSVEKAQEKIKSYF